MDSTKSVIRYITSSAYKNIFITKFPKVITYVKVTLALILPHAKVEMDFFPIPRIIDRNKLYSQWAIPWSPIMSIRWRYIFRNARGMTDANVIFIQVLCNVIGFDRSQTVSGNIFTSIYYYCVGDINLSGDVV